MLDAEDSVKAARRALRIFLPDEDFALASLKDPTKRYDTWVFRCKLRGKNASFVCKLSTADAAGRAKILNQYERLKSTNAAMKDPLFTTPQALAFVEKDCALIMEHARGDSFQQLLPQLSEIAEANAHLRNVGGWLSSFQQSTLKPAAFDAKPHMNWLLKKIKAHAENLIVIPDYDAFMLEFQQLEKHAAQAQGLASLRCVTHRDFHLGNVLFGRKGKVYGIDFENKKEDDALRDVISLLFDFAAKWPGKVPSFENVQAAAACFWQGYADTATDAAVFAFFQKFSALNGWSGLGNRTLSAQNKHHRLMQLKQFAKISLLDALR